MKELERLKVKAVCDFAKSQKSELSVFSPQKMKKPSAVERGASIIALHILAANMACHIQQKCYLKIM